MGATKNVRKKYRTVFFYNDIALFFSLYSYYDIFYFYNIIDNNDIASVVSFFVSRATTICNQSFKKIRVPVLICVHTTFFRVNHDESIK